jgi:DNA-binding transcriptional ArsR family regulator
MEGKELIRVLSTLANPQRLRVLGALSRQGRTHVSQLARDVALSRPLVHMHLQRLEAAGLVTGELELSEDGKARKFFMATQFAFSLTPEIVAEAALTLSETDGRAPSAEKEDRE